MIFIRCYYLLTSKKDLHLSNSSLSSFSEFFLVLFLVPFFPLLLLLLVLLLLIDFPWFFFSSPSSGFEFGTKTSDVWFDSSTTSDSANKHKHECRENAMIIRRVSSDGSVVELRSRDLEFDSHWFQLRLVNPAR